MELKPRRSHLPGEARRLVHSPHPRSLVWRKWASQGGLQSQKTPPHTHSIGHRGHPRSLGDSEIRPPALKLEVSPACRRVCCLLLGLRAAGCLGPVGFPRPPDIFCTLRVPSTQGTCFVWKTLPGAWSWGTWKGEHLAPAPWLPVHETLHAPGPAPASLRLCGALLPRQLLWDVLQRTLSSSFFFPHPFGGFFFIPTSAIRLLLLLLFPRNLEVVCLLLVFICR